MSPVYLFLALLVLAGCVGCGAEAPDPDEIGCCARHDSHTASHRIFR